MNEDIKWIVGILILLGIFWFVSGGPSDPSSSSPFIKPLSPASEGTTGTTYNTDFARINAGGPIANRYPPIGSTVAPSQTQQGQPTSGRTLSTTEEISQALSDAGVKADQIKRELEALQAANMRSPLSGKLVIAGRAGSTAPIGEYLVIRANPNNTEKVLLTGLRLQSPVSGLGIDIPKAAYIPLQNDVNIEQPVFLSPGEVAYVISGRSPLGMSFRLNKCTGFFTQYQSFNPGLPGRCPAPRTEPLPPPPTLYNDACLDYIGSLGSCRVITNPPTNLAPECRSYVMKEINYTKCVNAHRNDRDFYDGDWRIYLGRDTVLWKSRREVINLLDTNGKVIDAITY